MIDIKPRIWRRLLFPAGGTFLDLHKAIQAAGPWMDYHLFDFRISPEFGSRPIAGIPDDEDEVPMPDAKQIMLQAFFGTEPGIGCVYNYDYSDGWRLLITSHGIKALPYKFKRALLGGERAFPPEDCCGTSGYERCVEFCKTGYEEYDEGTLGPWLGKWQPEDLDLVKVKAKFDK